MSGFPYWRRGLVVLIASAILGPLIGGFVFSLASFGPTYMRDLPGIAYLALRVGLPFALATALPISWIVSRHGTIGYGATALIAFLVPCIVSLPVLGGLFVLMPFFAIPCVVAALVARALVGWLAWRLFDIAV
ncbi:hypothetical protein [Aliihoeflea sp. PC F10.4]